MPQNEVDDYDPFSRVTPKKLDLAFNMETSDPDDVFTLCILATHPRVHLRAVVITPGSPYQVGLVQHVLQILERTDVLVGARKPDYPKNCVSEFHYHWLGDVAPVKSKWFGYEALGQIYETSTLTFLSGAPLGNFHDFFLKRQHLAAYVPLIVVQGGFAGDNIMPPDEVIPKFKGKLTCPTFNLGGDRPAAHYILGMSPVQLPIQYYVSKNVCHGLAYDRYLHEEVKVVKDSHAGLALMYEGMERYLKKNPQGKLFHDPLAAAVAINATVCQYAQVELYEQKGQWGCSRSTTSNKFITTRIDRAKFRQVLFGMAYS
jgi:inosine-uridine nucleoside N-ribohydrolase